MTVTNTTTKKSHTGNGVTTAFTFDFKVFTSADILVYVDSVLKTITTDYTVTLNASLEGGTITFVVAPANGKAVLIKRSLTQTQPIVVPVEDRLPAEQTEKGYDKATMLVQQLQEELDRSAKLPTTTTFSGSLLLPEPVASKYIGWNGSASALENKDVADTNSTFTVPALAGNAGEYWRVNSGETNVEYVTISQLLTDLLTVAVATQAQMETATSNTVFTTPGRIQNHPGVGKGWAQVSYSGGVPVADSSHNVSSLSDTGTGDATVNWGTDLSSANNCPIASVLKDQSTGSVILASVAAIAAASARVKQFSVDANGNGVLADGLFQIVVFGDQ